MKQLQFNRNFDPRRRARHGARVTYIFKNNSHVTRFTCVFDSTIFASPLEQIMYENWWYFKDRPKAQLVTGIFVPIRKSHKIPLSLLCEN
jgi:hypothetical protein